MPRQYTVRHVISVLQKNGFKYTSQKGSHAKYRKRSDNEVIIVIVPVSKKELPYGTFRGILEQSEMVEDDFKKQ